MLDAGYGFPREKKVRLEKLTPLQGSCLTFLIWQTDSTTTHHRQPKEYASIRVVRCPDEITKTKIKNRTVENMKLLPNKSI